jgi:hypothetical protein
MDDFLLHCENVQLHLLSSKLSDGTSLDLKPDLKFQQQIVNKNAFYKMT